MRNNNNNYACHDVIIKVPINLRARLLGPHSVLILCTDNITGPAAVGDNSRAPIKVTGTTTALLRKVGGEGENRKEITREVVEDGAVDGVEKWGHGIRRGDVCCKII